MPKISLVFAFFVAFVVCFFSFVTPNSAYGYAPQINITFSYMDNSWQYVEQQSQNFYFQSKGQKFNRWGSLEARTELLQKIRKMGFTAEEALQYAFVGIEPIIKQMKDKINCPYKDAEMKFTPNKANVFEFSKEKLGYQLDFDAILQNIITSLKNSQDIKIELQPKVLQPQILLEDLQEFNHLKSSFYTSFNGDVANRVHNIINATKTFNGLKFENGKEYSFNKITGVRNEANGYLPANIIVNKKYVEGYGGGVCQVSSTLYNALLLGGIDICEVHSHSLTSNYVNYGFDAMVNYGTSDLRWVNNTGSTIYLKGYVKNNQIHFELYGKKDSKNLTYKRVTEIEKEIEPPKEEVIIDEAGEYSNLVIFSDESAYISYPKKGYKVRAILEVYQNEKLLERKLLRRVTYQPARGVKVVGNKPRVVQETEQVGILNKDIVEFWRNFR